MRPNLLGFEDRIRKILPKEITFRLNVNEISFVNILANHLPREYCGVQYMGKKPSKLGRHSAGNWLKEAE